MSEQSPAPASAERESAVASELENAAAVAEGEGQPAQPAAEPLADPSAPVEEKPKPKTRQQKAREAIFAKRSEQVAAEIAETLPPGPEAAEPAKEPEPAPVQQAPVEQPAPGTTPKPPPAQPQAQTVKVKTPEGEIELTTDQIADAWLARRDAARIVAGAQPAQPQPVSEPPAKVEAPQAPAASEPDDGEILRRIQFGDGDEAAQALKDLKASIARDIKRELGPSAGQDIESRVVARTMQEIDRHQELTKFGADFQDVLSDPDLRYVAAQRQYEMKGQALLTIGFTETELQTPGLDINALYRNMAVKGLVEPETGVYRKAAEAVRGKFLTGKPPASAGTKAPSQPGTQATVSSLDARREAKRSLPRPPAPASAAAPIGQAAPQRRTPSQIVQDMQRTRRGNAA